MKEFINIISDLKNKIYRQVYFLYGDEPYYIDEISNFIEKNVLSDTEKEFNQNIVYGIDIDVNTIISYARQFPMMANYNVLIIKEAQNIKNIEDLSLYIKNPLDSTILVICYKYKKIDKRKEFAKLVSKKGILFESKKIYDNKIPQWIENYVKANKYSITPKACALLTENLGNDLGKIVNEINKLLINIPENTKIDDQLIEKYIGINKDFNVFEFQMALSEKNIFKANQIANYFAANAKDNPLVKIIPILYAFFSKLLIYCQLKDKSRNNAASVLSISPFFVYQYQKAALKFSFKKNLKIINYLKEYDLKSKGIDSGSATDGELLKELVFKILH